MLKSLSVNAFTTFNAVEFCFAAGLNVVVGENGAGKSHLLKLAYAVSAVSHAARKMSPPPTKAQLQRDIATKLKAVFKPDELGRLVRSHRARKALGGRAGAEVAVSFDDEALAWAFSFSSVAKVEVKLTGEYAPKTFLGGEPIFIPTKEVMSMFPGFSTLYRNRELAIDETYFDLCEALNAPPLRGPRLDAIKQLLDPLEQRLGGSVIRKGDQFYLDSDKGTTEMPLVAEGIRKLATVAQLLRNGALTRKGMVFWDEPESNLNPRLIKVVAAMLLDLATQGVQVVVATHSFFLLKEFELLRRGSAAYQTTACRFISLALDNDGEPVFEQASELKDLQNLVSLDEELAQYDRELQGTAHG